MSGGTFLGGTLYTMTPVGMGGFTVDCCLEDARFCIPRDLNIQEGELPFVFNLHCKLYRGA